MGGRRLLSRRDLLIFAAILLLAAGIFLLLGRGGESARAVVEVDGEAIAERELGAMDGPEALAVSGADGVELVVEFGPDGARVLSSTCPDQTCVRTGKLTHPGETAICLPARTVLRLEGNNDTKTDAETY